MADNNLFKPAGIKEVIVFILMALGSVAASASTIIFIAAIIDVFFEATFFHQPKDVVLYGIIGFILGWLLLVSAFCYSLTHTKDTK